MEMNLNVLAAQFHALKQQEESITELRREAGKALADALAEAGKLEGSKTEKLEGFKVTVTYGLTRSVDKDALGEAWQSLPPEVQTAFDWKPSVSVTNLRKLDESAAKLAGKFFETKPAAPTVKVEKL